MIFKRSAGVPLPVLVPNLRAHFTHCPRVHVPGDGGRDLTQNYQPPVHLTGRGGAQIFGHPGIGGGQLLPGVGKAGDMHPGPLRGRPGLSRGGPPCTEASTFRERPTATYQGPAETWKCLCFRSGFVSHPSQFVLTKLNLISKAALGLGEGQRVGVRTVSPMSSFLRSTCSSACPPPLQPQSRALRPLDGQRCWTIIQLLECPGGRGTQGTVSSLRPSLHVWAWCPNEAATTSARVIPDDNQGDPGGPPRPEGCPTLRVREDKV